MPFVPADEAALGGLAPQIPEAVDARLPTPTGTGQIFREAFRRENDIVSTARALSQPGAAPYDPAFDPWSDIAGYEDYAASFIDANSPEDVAAMKAGIDRERYGYDIVANGGATGFFASVAASFLSPITLVPIGGSAVTIGRMGLRAGAGAVRVGVGAAAGTLAQEAILQATQETRTVGETAAAVAFSAVLGGVIGGAIGASTGRDLDAIAARVLRDTEEVADDMTANVPGGTGNLGAAAAAGRTMETEAIARLGGLEKALAKTSPTLRTQTSPSLNTKVIAQEIAEQPLLTKGNLRGIASPVSVEALIRQDMYPMYAALTEADDLFVRYRMGDAEPGFAARARIGVADLVRGTGGKLTHAEFMTEVGKAARRGDTHAIPEVAEAAKVVRRTVFDPARDRAIAAGIFTEGVDVKTAESYLTRLWDDELMIRERPEVIGKFTNWLAGEQAKKAEIQPRVQALLAERARIEGDAAPKPAAPLTVKAGRGAPEPSDLKPMDAESENAWRLYELMRDKGDAAEIARRAAQLDALFQRYGFAADPDKAKNIVKDWGADIEANIAARQAGDWSKTVDISETFDPDLRAEFLATRRAAREASGPSDVSARLADLERRLEDAVLEWEGKATRGARRASDARTDTAGSGAAARAIFDAAEAIAKVNTRLEAVELEDIANRIFDRIVSTPAGRVSYDVGGRGPAFSSRMRQEMPDLSAGPFKARVFAIPDEIVERYLISDIREVVRAHQRSVIPDLNLAERGFLNIEERVLKPITEDYEKLQRAAKTEAERVRLNNRKNADIRDVTAIIDRIRGTYALPKDPNHWGVQAARFLRDLNYLRLMGGMTITAIPDTARSIMAHGSMRVMRDGIGPLISNTKAFKLAAQEVKQAGTAMDMVMNTRAMNLADVTEEHARHSTIQRGMQWATSQFGVVSLMSPWNAAMKQFAGVLSQTRSLDMISAMVKGGDVGREEVARLARLGIDADMAGRIDAQAKKHAIRYENLWVANTNDWTDAEAVRVYRAALSKEVDEIIVEPGQEKPLIMSTELGKTIGQFRSFYLASMQRVAMAGLQRRDFAVVEGAVLMTALGMLSYYLSGKIAGRDISDDPAVWIKEGIDRSGLTGWAFEVNNMTEKLTRGTVGVSALLGSPPMSRYASRSAVDALLGPSLGTVKSAMDIVGGATSGEWTEAETRAARQMMPMQNLFYMRWLFDQVEQGANEALGIPMRAR
jgi:hypothetical protein